MRILILALILLSGDVRLQPVYSIEDKPCSIDYESMKDTLRICECAGIEIPACKVSVHYCRVFKDINKYKCEVK